MLSGRVFPRVRRPETKRGSAKGKDVKGTEIKFRIFQ
jgi:hypothetical protein